MTNNTSYERILARLGLVERRRLLLAAARSLLAGIAAGAGLFTLFGLAEAFAWFAPLVRTGMALLTFALAFGAFAISLGLALFRRPDSDELARMVERRWPDLRERLVSAVQLGRLKEKDLRGQSSDLVRLLVASAERELAALPVEDAVPRRSLVMAARSAAGAVLFLLIAAVTIPGASSGLFRLADFSRSYEKTGGVIIKTALGDASIIRGEDFITPGTLSGSTGPLRVFYRWNDTGAWSARPVEVSLRNGTFTLAVEKPRRSFTWYLEAGSRRTESHTVTVIERPVIERLALTLRYPAYTGLGTVVRTDNDGNIRALRGAEVILEAAANKPLREMILHWGDSTTVSCAVSGNSGKVSFRVERDMDYHLSLRDTLGIGDINPIVYRISAQEDEKPRIAILSPAGDIDLPRIMQFPILYRAADDFGISRIAIVVKLPHEESPRTIVLKKGRLPREIAEEHRWDLSGLNVLPGDTFTYYLSVLDNDAVRGPKEGVSETYTVRVPSLTEWMQDTVARQDAGMDRLRETRDQSSERNRAIEDVKRDLLDGRKMDWSEKNAVEDAKKKFETLQKEVKDFSEAVRETARKLGDEDLAALETVEKLEKISQMMDQIADGEMKEALKRLTQVPLQTDPRALKNALEQYQVTAEQIQKKLDNLLALLEQVKTIQRFDMARKVLDDLALKQAELAQKFRENPRNGALAREQEALAAEMEKLRNELKDISKTLGEKFQLNTKSFDEHLESRDISKGMKETAGNMEKGMEERARKGMDTANAELAELAEQMDALGASMKGANTRQVRERILNAMTELLAVSEDQEKLLKEFAGGAAEPLTKRQLEIMEGYGKAAKTMGELGSVSVELAAAVDQLAAGTRNAMKTSVDLLTGGNVKGGEQYARSSLSMLNNSVLFLNSLLKNSSQQQGGKGMSGDLMEQLQQIAGGQQSLQMQMGEGGSPELMQRLAAEQQKLAEMLDRLGKSATQDQRLREMLEKIAGDMDETARMMRRNEPRERVERQQLDIYRRLLDARRSRQERDEETPERKAWTAKRNESRGADRLSGDLGERNADLNARMKQALQDDFDPEFLRLIRQYFESLIREGGDSGGKKGE